MFRIFFLFGLLSLPASTAFAQKRMHKFQFLKPEEKVAGSLYSSIQLLDVREDTTTVGILGTSELSQQRLVPVPTLRTQLSTLFAELTTPPSTATNTTLLLRLKHFSMVEKALTITRRDYCRVQSDLLTHNNGQYQLLATLDTLVEVSGALTITKSFIEEASQTFTFFLAQNLSRMPAGNAPVYNFTEVVALDSLQKLQIPLYNVPVLKDGLYLTYAAFARQQPNTLNITVEPDGQQRYRVQKVNSEGSTPVGFNPKDVYAAVYKGIPYIATDYGLYELQKAENEFLFTGELKATHLDPALMATGMMYGAVGFLITHALSPSQEYYNLMLDYRNGRPVPVPARTAAKAAAKAGAPAALTDSLQKAGLPLFEMPVLAEGLYLKWESFAAQKPDYQVKAQAGNGTVMNIKSIGESQTRRFAAKETYALVHEGIPYVSVKGKYYKLRKSGTDWVFTAPTSLVEPSTDYATILRKIRIAPQNGALEIMREAGK